MYAIKKGLRKRLFNPCLANVENMVSSL